MNKIILAILTLMQFSIFSGKTCWGCRNRLDVKPVCKEFNNNSPEDIVRKDKKAESLARKLCRGRVKRVIEEPVLEIP